MYINKQERLKVVQYRALSFIMLVSNSSSLGHGMMPETLDATMGEIRREYRLKSLEADRCVMVSQDE